MHKKAMVIGAGVSGIQAALDLAEMGVETWLVEAGPSIGGRLAQLDKTFPTNDCAMCILSPKLVEAGGHPNIHILAMAEILKLDGEPPRLKATVLQRPRYVDETKCTGCGVCMAKCPTKVPDPYNKGLSTTKAIRIPFPQAVPALAVMDAAHCLFHQKGRCGVCQKVCPAGAIDFQQKAQTIELEVGSVILACGTGEFDARLKGEYGYGIFPNVMTSIEFERILSASGPTGGHVVRPSDQVEPKKIAILQCVGSRDVSAGNDHCSAVCCMQASKDAIIAREHLPGLETTIFYMDIRAYGKGFDRFVDRARQEHGTRLICGRIASVESDPRTNDLNIHYITRDGGVRNEAFDLLVLSVGLEPSGSSKEVARRLGVGLDLSGFVAVAPTAPVNTSRRGVFVCGSVCGPKDIPESVMEASGAASAAAAVLGEYPAREIAVEFPQEKDLRGDPPRVGVFVCRCGINIAATVDVPAVVEYASRLPRVRHAQEMLFSCAQDSQKTILAAIEKHRLNRVVVAACTPRTHEPLFQKTLRHAGLNPFMFEFANIREHCSWVHQKEPVKATAKAKDLVRSAVTKVILAEPLYRKTLGVMKGAMVIGGGLAGMTAALDLASQGVRTHLIEKTDRLGGNLLHVKSTLDGQETAGMLAELVKKVEGHPGITVYRNARIRSITGYVGNFKTILEAGGASAIGRAPQLGAAGPQGPAVEIEYGAVIVAAGGSEYEPTEYLFNQDDRVVTQRQFEEMLHAEDTSALAKLKTVVMIQCVGSRDPKHDYCSRVCCSNAIKNAIRLKELSPGTNLYVLYRDIRTYGLKERRYRQAREMGVVFVRFDTDTPPIVHRDGGGLTVRAGDDLLGASLVIRPNLLVLSSGIVANPDNKTLSQLLKVPLEADGYFLEAHVKLRPVDFATDGVFVCGLSHYPKDISETIAQARAAAGRAATVLCKTAIEAEGKVACVRAERCSGCGECAAVCAYQAIELDPVLRVAVVNEALCKGCGACAASCRACAIDLGGFRNEQMLSALNAL